MPEGRVAQLATSALLTQFAITTSQAAIQPIGNFISPICEVPDLTFRYKKYDNKNRFKLPQTRRQIGDKVTTLGFSADDVAGILNPHALDFPIPNVAGLSDQGLQYSIQEAQTTLADVSGLSLENDILSIAVQALTGGQVYLDYGDDTVDPISDPTSGLDVVLLAITLAAKNGAPVKILFGTNAFRKFRNNKLVRGRYIVSAGRGNGVGTVSPGISEVGGLLITNPEVKMSMMVIDTAAAGLPESMQFILDNAVIIFASNLTPNRMDPSFMKTFSPMGGFFKPGSYVTQDQRDEVLKMDWTTNPTVTNTVAAQLIITTVAP